MEFNNPIFQALLGLVIFLHWIKDVLRRNEVNGQVGTFGILHT